MKSVLLLMLQQVRLMPGRGKEAARSRQKVGRASQDVGVEGASTGGGRGGGDGGGWQ